MIASRLPDEAARHNAYRIWRLPQRRVAHTLSPTMSNPSLFEEVDAAAELLSKGAVLPVTTEDYQIEFRQIQKRVLPHFTASSLPSVHEAIERWHTYAKRTMERRSS